MSALEDVTRARALLVGAIEALDVGFCMYDADDRLVICNERYRAIYANVKEEACARYTGTGLPARAVPQSHRGHRPQPARRRVVADRRASRDQGGTREVLLDGRWYRLDEAHTPEGLTVSLRTDITAIGQLKSRA